MNSLQVSKAAESFTPVAISLNEKASPRFSAIAQGGLYRSWPQRLVHVRFALTSK
jgi:hypothetical protein